MITLNKPSNNDCVVKERGKEERMAVLKVSFSKFETFTADFDSTSKESAEEALCKYAEYFQRYQKIHTISARRWTYPVVYVNDKMAYKVAPNGRLIEL